MTLIDQLEDELKEILKAYEFELADKQTLDGIMRDVEAYLNIIKNQQRQLIPAISDIKYNDNDQSFTFVFSYEHWNPTPAEAVNKLTWKV